MGFWGGGGAPGSYTNNFYIRNKKKEKEDQDQKNKLHPKTQQGGFLNERGAPENINNTPPPQFDVHSFQVKNTENTVE